MAAISSSAEASLKLCTVCLSLLAAPCALALAAAPSPPSRCSTCRGPVHSWATLPVSFHSSHSHTGPTGAFSELDIETIRKFPLVTIEKWQGAAAREPLARDQQLLSGDRSGAVDCSIFNCTCQGMADYYGKSNHTTWGCAPPSAQKWWDARKCNPKHCNTGLCAGPGCKVPGAFPCFHPPPPPEPHPMGKPVFLWEEDAWVAAATQIKQANPNASVVVWMDTMLVYTGWNWSPTGAQNNTLNTTLNPDIKGPCRTGHFRPAEYLETAGRALLLKNKSGLPALQKWSNCHVYDHSQAAGRQYWTDMCLSMTASGVIDGCGADFSAMGGNSWSDHTPPRIAGDLGLDLAAAKAWGDGHRQMMMETTAALGDGILVAKDHAELGDHANAVLQEGCDAANSTIVMLQGLATRARSLGKRLVYQCHTNAPVETGNLPAFLIGAGVDHYLTIGGWVDDAASAHWSPLFDRPLGEPLGDGVCDVATATWHREFKSGTKVTFNAKTSTGAIAWV
eukprot:SAG22_NODE_92_length_20892_cov_11.188429_10_plen_507_part_00